VIRLKPQAEQNSYEFRTSKGMVTAVRRKLYLPAFSILAIILLLLVVIGISTYRNLDRQRQTALQLLHRQGVILLHTLEAAASSGLAMQGWNSQALDQLLAELGTDPDIAYICMVDPSGAVLSHSEKNPPHVDRQWAARVKPEAPVQSRLHLGTMGEEIYEIAKIFGSGPRTPTAGPLTASSPHDTGGGSSPAGGIILVGMKMDIIAAAHRADLHHAVLMAAIVLALGASALFFTYVIQKYYLVNRSLKQAQDYTRQVVASLATGLISIDSMGRVQAFNRPALDMLDIPADQLQDRELSGILDFDATGIADTLNYRQSVLEREVGYRAPSGRQLPLAVNVSPISDGRGAGSGAVILLRDLSEIKALEFKMRNAEKLAAVGEMAASVAHEIRNPLSSIKGFAQFLNKNCKCGGHHQEYIQIMIQEVDRINSVVTNLLNFARPLAPDLRLTDVGSLVAHAVRLVQPEAEERNIVLHTRIEIAEPALHVDAHQLTQALLNLLLNAMGAVERDGTVTVALDSDSATGEICLSVEDNGPGIVPELHEKIFDPFFTTREKGTGLGLAIVRKIVEHHNGRIMLQSPVPGKMGGCRFAIYLKASRGINEAAQLDRAAKP
jgi:two-component system sensor histidine kinase HydH